MLTVINRHTSKYIVPTIKPEENGKASKAYHEATITFMKGMPRNSINERTEVRAYVDVPSPEKSSCIHEVLLTVQPWLPYEAKERDISSSLQISVTLRSQCGIEGGALL